MENAKDGENEGIFDACCKLRRLLLGPKETNIIVSDKEELVITASEVLGTAQFQGEYKMLAKDIKTLNLTNNELTDDTLVLVVDMLVEQCGIFWHVDLKWNRLTINCIQHIKKLITAFQFKIVVDLRYNSMIYEEMHRTLEEENIKDYVEYRDPATCYYQQAFVLQKRNEEGIQGLVESTKKLEATVGQMVRSAQNRSKEMERAIEHLLLNKLSKDYDCDSLTSKFNGGKIKASNGDELVQWDAILVGKRLTDNEYKLLFVEVKEIPHPNDIINEQNTEKLDFKTKIERMCKYLRVTLNSETGNYRVAYQTQRNSLSHYKDSSLVFVYASGLMGEDVKSKVRELSTMMKDVQLMTAESPRLTECHLTLY
eukprot:scaffold297_cov164-Ochromonas_danica.AAC.16